MGLEDILVSLRAELAALERELRHELPQRIMAAREFGDLTENAEYEALKERQGFVHARINYLKQRIAALSQVNLNAIPRNRIAFGSTVHLKDLESGEVRVYKLVAPEEVNASQGLISAASPIGRSLLGHREGEQVTVATPGGTRQYEVVKIVTIHDAPEF